MSDAGQKQMDCNWSSGVTTDDQMKCDCTLGEACHVTDYVETMFKQRYREQMIKLMHAVIENPNHDCTGDTKCVKNLKNEMNVVRSLKNNPWPDLTSMFITSKESVCVTTRKVLDVVSECDDEMDINKVLCLCTCVTDLCTLLVSKNYGSMTCEIVQTYVNYILEQNMLACRDFLFWLDHL